MQFLFDVGQGGMGPIMWNLNPTGAPCEDLPTLASYDGNRTSSNLLALRPL
jgi:hypothetical protein